MMVAKTVAAENREEKVEYLKTWATAVSGKDPEKLPIVADAKSELMNRFPKGLGTDLIAQTLKELHREWAHISIELPPPKTRAQLRVVALAKIAEIMVKEKIETVTIDGAGCIMAMKSF